MSTITAVGHRPRQLRVAEATGGRAGHGAEGGLVPRVGRRSAAAPSLRLTPRGRLVVLLLALSVALIVGVFLGAGSVATQERGTPAPTRMVVVGDGQTLWGIASEIAAADPHTDVRGVIHEIKGLNALESGMLYAGQRIRVPAAR